jgi:hypothetical protein
MLYFKSAVEYGLAKLDSYWDVLIMQLNLSFYCIATALYLRL